MGMYPRIPSSSRGVDADISTGVFDCSEIGRLPGKRREERLLQRVAYLGL